MDGMDKAIIVWRFEDAPEEYRKIADQGGDEDWLAFIPAGFDSEYISWMEVGFGCGDAISFPVKGGEIRVGTHA